MIFNIKICRKTKFQAESERNDEAESMTISKLQTKSLEQKVSIFPLENIAELKIDNN